MRDVLPRFLLTLVVMQLFVLIFWQSVVSAKPHFDAPTKAEDEQSTQTNVTPQELENMSFAEPKRGVFDRYIYKFNKRDYYYPYRKEFSIHGGAVLGVVDSTDDDSAVNVLIGFNYLLEKLTSPKWEVGAELSTVGNGHLHIVKREIYNEKGSFRPYYEYGIMHKLVPEEKFSSLSNWENYLVMVGLGMNDILRPPKSVQMELNFAAGTEDVLVMFTYGYAWGF